MCIRDRRGSGTRSVAGRKIPSPSETDGRAPARAGPSGKVGTLSSRAEPAEDGGGSPSGLPDGFLFGVATAGFQVEGGFNGPGQPANNWLAWEQVGRVEPSGDAVGFCCLLYTSMVTA